MLILSMRKVEIKWLSQGSDTEKFLGWGSRHKYTFLHGNLPQLPEIDLRKMAWGKGEGQLISAMTKCKPLASLTSVPKTTIRGMVTICSSHLPEVQQEKLAYSRAVRKHAHTLLIRQDSAGKVVGHWDKFLIKYLIFMEFSFWVHRIFHCILMITL